MKKILMLCAVLALSSCYYADIDPNYYHRTTHVREVHHHEMHFYRPEDHRLKSHKKAKPAAKPVAEHHNSAKKAPSFGKIGGPATEHQTPKHHHRR